MKRFIGGGVALVLIGLAGAAAAADMLYQAPPDSLTEGLNGKPLWSAQAQCAGLFGAASQTFSDSGDSAAAEEAKSLALSFADDAINRVRQDRGLERAAAIQVIQPAVLKGREDAQRVLASDRAPVLSPWNFARSACLDVAESYKG